MKKTIHLFTYDPNKPAIEHYKKLNPDYEIVRFDNYDRISDTYKKYFDVLKQFLLNKNGEEIFLLYELFKLSILEEEGGWWCDVKRLQDKPLDQIAIDYDMENKFSYFTFQQFNTSNIYVPPQWNGWHLIHTFVQYIINNPKFFHILFIGRCVSHISAIHPQDIQQINDNAIVNFQQTKLQKMGHVSMSYNQNENSPEVIAMIKRYISSQNKWVEAGKPIRSATEMKQIYSICKSCEHFRKDLFGSRCSLCNCRLHDTRVKLNKIAMATEECPDTPPRW